MVAVVIPHWSTLTHLTIKRLGHSRVQIRCFSILEIELIRMVTMVIPHWSTPWGGIIGQMMDPHVELGYQLDSDVRTWLSLFCENVFLTPYNQTLNQAIKQASKQVTLVFETRLTLDCRPAPLIVTKPFSTKQWTNICIWIFTWILRFNVSYVSPSAC